MVKKEDRRIQKSRTSIKRAFIDLLDKKEFENISVQDIADRADINRGTFYLHYQDKFDLFETYFDELLNELISTLDISCQEREQIKSGGRIRKRDNDPYVQFFKHFQRYSYFYKPMFQSQGGTYFYKQMIEVFKKHFYQVDHHLNDREEALNMDQEFMMYSIVHVYLGAINYWLENDMSDSPEIMGEQLNSLLYSMSQNF